MLGAPRVGNIICFSFEINVRVRALRVNADLNIGDIFLNLETALDFTGFNWTAASIVHSNMLFMYTGMAPGQVRLWLIEVLDSLSY